MKLLEYYPTSSRTLDELSALVSSDLEHLDSVLRDAMESPIGPIPRVGQHLLEAGGKRLRPLLAILAARAAQAPITLGVAVGVAAELIHTATLFHDDVVDDGRVRRGRPAARMVYGNGVVVLVGDYCLARALATVTGTGNISIVQSLAATVKEMAEGEVAQLERAGNPNVTVEHYSEVIDRKTASLIAWSARVGGALPDAQDGALGRYGRALGRAFQIADDILDCAVSEDVTGKTVGNDLREGKLTLPVLLACQSEPALRSRIRSVLGENGVATEEVPGLLRAVERAGGVRAARDQAHRLVDQAVSELRVLDAGPYRDALAALAHLCVDRAR